MRLGSLRLPARSSPRLQTADYLALLETIDQSVIFTDLDGRIRFWNPGATQIFGYPADEMLGKTPAMLYPEEDPDRFASDVKRILGGEDFVGDWQGRRQDGSPVWVEIRTTVVRDPMGAPVGFLGVARDVTQRRRSEAARVKQQVLDTVARLAGGVAHESNNQMTVVLGEACLLLDRADLPASMRPQLSRIKRAAERITEVTRQLLSFSRRQLSRPRILDLNAAITGLRSDIQLGLDHNIELHLTLSPGVPAVRMDESQLKQVLMNLALNARDAMPRGGTLFLESRELVISSELTLEGAVVGPGHYAELLVRDVGTGMDPETLAHLFEPFFTTKEPGKGTGLGLASVHGVIKQNGGYVFAESTPRRGTCFRILLPAAFQK